MKLFFREYGQGQPLIILHGLFGNCDNWMTQARMLAPYFRVLTIDQRNHGLSPHSPEFNYQLLTEDLHEFILQHDLHEVLLLGHSMGGKTVMNYAVLHPERVAKMVVVDIMPRDYPPHHDHILEGLRAIRLETLQNRNDAEAMMSPFVPEPGVRQFLLKNLARTPEGFVWRINLGSLERNIERLGEGMQYDGKYEGPSLFLTGSRSDYYEAGDERLVFNYFPEATFDTLDTGHWVQAEKPQEFVEKVLAFLR